MSARFFEGTLHASLYAKYRPTAPLILVEEVVNYLKNKYNGPLKAAVDVGCGSGQSTQVLADKFTHVTGVDVSEAQINEAKKAESFYNIQYRVSLAEKLPFEDQSVQLVTSGQACHWFDVPKFYKEANRILVPNGVLAIYAYDIPRLQYKDKGDQLCSILDKIYDTDTKGYWASERVLVEQKYSDERFLFPFAESIRINFPFERNLNLKDLEGYVMCWHGFQKYKEMNGEEAVQKILSRLIEDVMTVVNDPSKSPEDIQLTLKYTFFLIMGRK